MAAATGRRRTFLMAFVIALAVMWMTGAISRWGQWYSDQPYYRAQVHAFFDGRLALTNNVEGVQHDLAYVDGGVQHVWGLGVPIWLSAFEAIGRPLGITPFPDRIAMLFGVMLFMYALLRAWTGRRGDRTPASWGAFILCAFMPSVLCMLRGRIAVYEEAEAYSYGTSILLMVGVIAMLRAPTRWKYLLIVAFAGLTGLMRPTVWFYGVATAVCTTFLYIRSVGGVRRALTTVMLAICLFIAGGGVLYGTNYLRFGNGAEFGHRLNIEDLPGNIYATRFSYPFERISTGAAAKELFGGMFGSPEKRARKGYYFYDKKLHAGQSPLPRWREYYFTTYPIIWIPILLAGLVLTGFGWLRIRRKVPPPDATSESIDGPALLRESRWLGAWGLIAAVPLLAFYLRSPSVSSRYFLDVAPTMVVWMVIAWRHFAARIYPSVWGTVALVVLAGLWFYQSISFTAVRPWMSPVRYGAAVASMLKTADPVTLSNPIPVDYDFDDPDLIESIGTEQFFCKCFVDEYLEQACDHSYDDADDCFLIGNSESREHTQRFDNDGPPMSICSDEWPYECTRENPDPALPEALPDVPEHMVVKRKVGRALYENGTEWDINTGLIGPATLFYVDAPEYLDVEVAQDTRILPIVDWVPQVRAKIQLEELKLESVSSTARGVKFHFRGPKTPKYQKGIQIAFIAFGTDEMIDEDASGYLLRRVAWRKHAPAERGDNSLAVSTSDVH